MAKDAKDDDGPRSNTREPAKGILKAPRITFPEQIEERRVISIPFKDSIDEVVKVITKSNLN